MSEEKNTGAVVKKSSSASRNEHLAPIRRDTEARWYVVHTYSGYENKVKTNIEKLVENRDMKDKVFEIVIPTETVSETRDNKTKIKEKKSFPGYVLVKMIVTDESWYLVRNTQGVTGFVGQGSEPIPLSDEEIRRLGVEKVEIVIDVSEGDAVRLISGPFKGFTGTVVSVNLLDPRARGENTGKTDTVKVMIDMFGRQTPVDLELSQIDKINK